MDIGTIAHTGSYSLHVHMAQVPNSALASCGVKTRPTSIFSSTPMYFRAWVYMTVYAGASPEFIVAAQSSTNGASGGIGVNPTGLFTSGVVNSGGNDYAHTSMGTLAMNTWTCLELEIDTDYGTYPNGMLAAWDDTSGTADPQLAGTAKLQPLVSATFGLSFNGPSLATDIYIDDIAISNTYVGCSQ